MKKHKKPRRKRNRRPRDAQDALEMKEPDDANKYEDLAADSALDLFSIWFSLDSILRKTDYRSFAMMEETCKEIRDMCNKKDMKVPADFRLVTVSEDLLDEIVLFTHADKDEKECSVPWRRLAANVIVNSELINIRKPLTSAMAATLTDLFTINQAKARKFRLESEVSCSPTEFGRILSMLNVKFFDSQTSLQSSFFELDVFQGLNINIVYCEIEDRHLSRLRGQNLWMRNDRITAGGINRFLKQWRLGDRQIQIFDIEFCTSIGTRNFGAILDGLDANPIWTPDHHKDSMISHIPLNHFPEMITGVPEHLYSLWRSESIRDIFIIRLNNTRIEGFRSTCEVDFLQGYIDEYERQKSGRERMRKIREMRRGGPDCDIIIICVFFGGFLTFMLAFVLCSEDSMVYIVDRLGLLRKR